MCPASCLEHNAPNLPHQSLLCFSSLQNSTSKKRNLIFHSLFSSPFTSLELLFPRVRWCPCEYIQWPHFQYILLDLLAASGPADPDPFCSPPFPGFHDFISLDFLSLQPLFYSDSSSSAWVLVLTMSQPFSLFSVLAAWESPRTSLTLCPHDPDLYLPLMLLSWAPDPVYTTNSGSSHRQFLWASQTPFYLNRIHLSSPWLTLLL